MREQDLEAMESAYALLGIVAGFSLLFVVLVVYAIISYIV